MLFLLRTSLISRPPLWTVFMACYFFLEHQLFALQRLGLFLVFLFDDFPDIFGLFLLLVIGWN